MTLFSHFIMKNKALLYKCLSHVLYAPTLQIHGITQARLVSFRTNLVFEGVYNKSPCVVKLISHKFPEMREMMKYEEELLHELRDFKCTPKPIQLIHAQGSTYTKMLRMLREGTNKPYEISFLIREYIPGNPLKQKEKLTQDEYETVSEIVSKTHELGYAGLGIRARENFVRTSNGRLVFIDLGAHSKENCLNCNLFTNYLARDYNELQTLKPS
jgi:predicted Ser/Thr protein kinase